MMSIPTGPEKGATKHPAQKGGRGYLLLAIARFKAGNGLQQVSCERNIQTPSIGCI
jgi:hypothetical protein